MDSICIEKTIIAFFAIKNGLPIVPKVITYLGRIVQYQYRGYHRSQQHVVVKYVTVRRDSVLVGAWYNISKKNQSYYDYDYLKNNPYRTVSGTVSAS